VLCTNDLSKMMRLGLSRNTWSLYHRH